MMLFSDLYKANTYDISHVTDVHPMVDSLTTMDDYEAFVMGGNLMIFQGENYTDIALSTRMTIVGAQQLYRFYSLRELLLSIDGVSLTHHGISLPHSAMDTHGEEIISHVLSSRYTIFPYTYWGKYFRSLYDRLGLIFGNEFFLASSCIYPYFSDIGKAAISLTSPYGKVLLHGNDEVVPEVIVDDTYLVYPDAAHILSRDELDVLSSRKDVFIGNDGVYVLVPWGTNMSAAGNVIASVRRIPAKERYTLIPREHSAEVDKLPRMLFARYMDKTLDPHSYPLGNHSMIDYSDVHSMKEGVYR